MIRLEKASFAFGPRRILEGADLAIPDGARVGLVGRNGAGKTTLFRILLGDLALEAGVLVAPKGQRAVYLPQYPELPGEESILEHVLASHPAIRDLRDELRSVEEKMVAERDPAKLDRLFERYRGLRRDFEARGGYAVDAQAADVLAGLGFSRRELWKALGTLSPGEKNRVALAKVLLSDADLFLLDEPTNHLDFEMLEWLERFLRTPRKGGSGREVTAIVASHDRYFLNQFADRIVEIADGRLAAYRGNYDDYVERRAEDLERQAKEYRLQRAEIEKEEEFIRRNFAAQKARQAKSREKKLARMERIEAPRAEGGGPRIRFDRAASTGDLLVRLRDLDCGYGGVPLVSGVCLELRPGDRVAVVGPNGCGKTTVLRCAVGELEPLRGEVRRGPKAALGYYPQDLSVEGGPRTIFDTVHDLVPRWSDQEVRNLLAAFLFRGDEIHVPTAALSGGERARLALIRLILSGANVLVLDEPTNHLDILSRAALEESLLEFGGAVLFVSHDRCFVERLATRVYAIGDGEFVELLGGYEEYRALSREAAAQARPEPRPEPEEKASDPEARARARRAEEERLLRRIAKVEEALRAKHEDAGREEHYRNPEAMRRLKREIRELEAELDGLYRTWEALES